MLQIIGLSFAGIILYIGLGLVYQVFDSSEEEEMEFEIGIRVIFWPFYLLVLGCIMIGFAWVFSCVILGRFVNIIRDKREKGKTKKIVPISEVEIEPNPNPPTPNPVDTMKEEPGEFLPNTRVSFDDDEDDEDKIKLKLI